MPFDRGIIGNEIADLNAKEALTLLLSESQTSISYQELIYYARNQRQG